MRVHLPWFPVARTAACAAVMAVSLAACGIDSDLWSARPSAETDKVAADHQALADCLYAELGGANTPGLRVERQSSTLSRVSMVIDSNAFWDVQLEGARETKGGPSTKVVFTNHNQGAAGTTNQTRARQAYVQCVSKLSPPPPKVEDDGGRLPPLCSYCSTTR